MTSDLSPKQLAAETGLSPAFIYREIARGHLIAYRAGNRLRIERQAVADWKEQSKVGPCRRNPMHEPDTSPKPGKPEGRFTSDLKATGGRHEHRNGQVADGGLDGATRGAVRRGAPRTFKRKEDAKVFEAELLRRRSLGELAYLEASRKTLAELAGEWWELYAKPNLSNYTLAGYAPLLDSHVLPRLGGLRLREVTPEVLARFRADFGGRWRGPPCGPCLARDRPGHVQPRAELGLGDEQSRQGRAEAELQA